MKRWLIRQLVIPWLRDRALVLPASKRKELTEKLHVDEMVISTIEHHIRNAIIEALIRGDH